MQSLQMRCPVAAIIGLSMAMMANAPIALPCARSVCISLIFSSSGQPASVTPNGDFLEFAASCDPSDPWRQESLPCVWHQMQ